MWLWESEPRGSHFGVETLIWINVTPPFSDFDNPPRNRQKDDPSFQLPLLSEAAAALLGPALRAASGAGRT